MEGLVHSSDRPRHVSLDNHCMPKPLHHGPGFRACSVGESELSNETDSPLSSSQNAFFKPTPKHCQKLNLTGQRPRCSTVSSTSRRFASSENIHPIQVIEPELSDGLRFVHGFGTIESNNVARKRQKFDFAVSRFETQDKSWTGATLTTVHAKIIAVRSPPRSHIEGFDGQSSVDNSDIEAASDNDRSDACNLDTELDTAATPCYLVISSRKQRLRPNQREQAGNKISKWTKDRYIPRRLPHDELRDRLIIGNTEAGRYRWPQRDAMDPFRQNVAYHRLPMHGEIAVLGRDGRMGSARTSRALAQSQPRLLNTYQGFSWTSPWTSETTAHIGGRMAIAGPQTEAVSSVPTYIPSFLMTASPEDDSRMYEERVALALGVNRTKRILRPQGSVFFERTSSISHRPAERRIRDMPIWKDNAWSRQTGYSLLDAPGLRDDFYCSILAYSHTANRLAVGLGARVYFWSESSGVVEAPKELRITGISAAHVTSLAFSSEEGRRSILATGRGDKSLVLYSPLDQEPRYLRMVMPNAPSHVCFRPTVVCRPSQRQAEYITENEVLLVGDETGAVSIYFVEWPSSKTRFLFGWHGSIALHTRVVTHTQQICGIVWSSDGAWFATGGNDNLCCLFNGRRLIDSNLPAHPSHLRVRVDQAQNVLIDVGPSPPRTDPPLGFLHVKHYWRINAAVKAMAFCPWQRGLIALGGGSNDRRIHFFHTISGACLARIDCAAQITSLIWSRTRREIAATLGFAQPDHPVRIVVYAWPSCKQIVAIPWRGDMRALYAIPYPGGPDLGRAGCEGGSWGPRTREEGCIVVAASDSSVKFHEIWCRAKKGVRSRYGSLCGSDILEGLHDIEKDGLEMIR